MRNDVLRNTTARGFLIDLSFRVPPVHLFVRGGLLMTTTPRRLTDEDRAFVRRHKPDLLVLVLINADATLDRWLALRAGTLGREMRDRGCYLCGEPLPPTLALRARCCWCALALRLYAGAPIPASLIGLFPEAIRGSCAPLPPGDPDVLPFDYAMPELPQEVPA